MEIDNDYMPVFGIHLIQRDGHRVDGEVPPSQVTRYPVRSRDEVDGRTFRHHNASGPHFVMEEHVPTANRVGQVSCGLE